MVKKSGTEHVLTYLRGFKSGKGLYIIKPKDPLLLREICRKLGYPYTSEIAYIGKAERDLYTRAKQEMGWSNFEAATFVRKIGMYLGLDVRDKRNESLKKRTRDFICDNFQIECFSILEDIQRHETLWIKRFRPCLNVKKK